MTNISTNSSRKNHCLTCTIIGITSVLVCVYILFDVLLFRIFLLHLPQRYFGYLPETVKIMAQRSKSGVIPHDYIALLGDSYSFGLDYGTRTSYNYLLREKTGQDVFCLGANGAGSITGMCIAPVQKLYAVNKCYLYDVALPKTVICYFYEGNDLDNNLAEINNYGLIEDELLSNSAFITALKKITLDTLDNHMLSNSFPGTIHDSKFLLYEFILNMSRNLFSGNAFYRNLMKRGNANSGRRRFVLPTVKLSGINRVRIQDTITAIPDCLQSPGLALNEEENAEALLAFKRSLAFVKQYFPESRIYVVYIPSPLTCYDIVSDNVSIETYAAEKHDNNIYSSLLVNEYSDVIFNEVRLYASELNIPVIDPRSALREKAKTILIHGPDDWWHFNKIGYDVLMGEIAGGIAGDKRTAVK